MENYTGPDDIRQDPAEIRSEEIVDFLYGQMCSRYPDWKLSSGEGFSRYALSALQGAYADSRNYVDYRLGGKVRDRDFKDLD